MRDIEARLNSFSEHFNERVFPFNAARNIQLRHAEIVTEWLQLIEHITGNVVSANSEGEAILKHIFQTVKLLLIKGDDISAWHGQCLVAAAAERLFPGAVAGFHLSVAARLSIYMNLQEEAEYYIEKMRSHVSDEDHALSHILYELRSLVLSHRKQFRESMYLIMESIDHLQRCSSAELSTWSGADKDTLLANRYHHVADCWINLGWDIQQSKRAMYISKARGFLRLACQLPQNETEAFMTSIHEVRLTILEGRLQEARHQIDKLTSEEKAVSHQVATIYPLLYGLLAQIDFLENDPQTMIAHLSTALAESHHFHHALQEFQIVDLALGLLWEKKVTRQEMEPLFKSMIVMLEAKDWYTGHGHSRTVAELTMALWSKWQNTAPSPKVGDDFYWAAYLHDIGKLLLPRSLLSKIAPLSEQEFAIIRRHPRKSKEILSAFGVMTIARMAGEHHQDACGQGYPGNEPASPMGLCIAIADILEAATSPGRLYRKPKSLTTVLEELRALGPDRYPPELLAAAASQEIIRYDQ